MKKFLLTLLVIFLAYLSAFYTSGASEKQDLFDLGDSPFMYRLKCTITGETDTTDADQLYNRAGNYLYAEEYELAVKDYEKALELNPSIYFIRIDLAKAWLGLKDTAKAIGCLREHIVKSDIPDDAYLELGILYKDMGYADSAIFYYEKALITNSENHQSNYQLAILYFDKKEYSNALNAINKAIELSQYELPYRNLRRKIYLIQDQKELAELDYQYILSSDANFFGNYDTKAKEANEEGNYQAAIEYYKLALENQPLDKELLKSKAWAYNSIKKYDSALIDFKQLIEIDPNNYLSYFNVAYTLDLLDDVKGSIKYYDTSIKMEGNNHLSYNNRGYEYYRLKNYKKAEADYTKSIKIENDYFLNYYNRGALYFDQKKYKKAIDDYKKASELTEKNHTIIYDIALAYEKLKNKKEMLYYFNEYLKVAGEEDTTRYNYSVKRVSELSK